MRRPVIFLFLSFAFGISLEYHLMLTPVKCFVLMAVLPAIYSLSRTLNRHRERVGLACLFIFVMLLGSVYFNLADQHGDPLEAAEGKTCTVQGRIITIQVKDEASWQMLITAKNTGKRLVQVKGEMEAPEKMIGKWAVLSGKVTLPPSQRNPGLFDYQLYLKTKGVGVILQSDTSRITILTDHSSAFFTMLARLKYGFQNRLAEVMAPDAFGLMIGMLFGDCSLIGEETYEAFQKNGIAHILSVSGIHVGIVYLFISRLFGRKRTRVFYLVTALMLVLYAALAEFSPSVVRAVVMIVIHMFSKVAYQRYDFISCTSVSALAMLLVNPFNLFSTGFQLSFIAVFCLASLLPLVNRMLSTIEESGKNELLTAGLRYLSPLLIIQAGMAPLTAYLFNYFSVVSLFLNIPIIAISSLIIPIGICLIPVSFFGGVIFGIGAMTAEFLVHCMLWMNDLFFLPGIGFFNMTSPEILLLILFYCFFFFLSSEYFRILYQRKHRRAIANCCCIIMLLSFLISAVVDDGYRDGSLIFLDVGQGDCLHIRTDSGKNILIDGGGSQGFKVGEKILLPYLLKNGVKSIDLAIATHLHDDHYLGLQELAGQIKIKKLALYEANQLREQEILADTVLKRENLLYLAEGDRIRIEEDFWIDVLYPDKQSVAAYERLILEEDDENRSSLLLKVSAKGMTILMTGDLGLEGEEEVLRHYEDSSGVLVSDVLKIGHHGSRYSTGAEFLDAVSPEIAVFQVGKNNFGHPHPSVIEKCLKKDIIVYRNDLDGAIIFLEEDQRWHIKTMLRRNTHIKE